MAFSFQSKHGSPGREAASRKLDVAAAVTGAAALLLTVLGLRAEGRLWICECGRVYLWAGDIWSADNSQQLFDPYTWTHLLHGLILAQIVAALIPRLSPAWQLTVGTILECGWELVENSSFVIERYRTATISLGYVGDTVVNSLGDILICGVGIVVGRYLGGWRSAALFVLTEIVLLVWIRDSLLLNVLMLFYPIEGVTAWQMGR